jgi:predicted nucleic acid-binding protein
MIVSNTTPLIAFARIGELDLLQKIVGYILIPDAVWREVTEAGNRLGAGKIQNASWVGSRTVRTIPPELIP